MSATRKRGFSAAMRTFGRALRMPAALLKDRLSRLCRLGPPVQPRCRSYTKYDALQVPQGATAARAARLRAVSSVQVGRTATEPTTIPSAFLFPMIRTVVSSNRKARSPEIRLVVRPRANALPAQGPLARVCRARSDPEAIMPIPAEIGRAHV